MSDTSELSSLGSQKTEYHYDGPEASQLETFVYDASAGISQLVGFQTDEFTSLCPKTGQPDFANIDIVYLPNKKGVESKSLKLYLFRFRNHGSFHEDCINKIARDLVEVLDPIALRVTGDFTRRGGIAIKPVSWYAAPNYSIGHFSQLVDSYDSYNFVR